MGECYTFGDTSVRASSVLPTTIIATCTTRFPSFPFIPLLALIIILIAACGGSASNATPAAESALSNQTALDLVKRSAEVMESVKSFRSEIEMQGEVLGEKFSMTMDTALSRDQWMQNTMVLDGPEGDVKIEQVIAPPDVYTNLPDTGFGWIRQDLSDLAREAGVSAESMTDPTAYSTSFLFGDELPWEQYTVSSLGGETIDGIQTEHLKIQVDLAELLAIMSPEGKEKFAQAMGPMSSMIAGDGTQQMKFEKLEVWIDDSGLQRRISMSIAIGDDINMNMDVLVRDYDEDIVINRPDDYTDLP